MKSVFDFFFFLATPRGLGDLSSLTRDQTRAMAVKAPSPNHWTTRESVFFFFNLFYLFIYFWLRLVFVAVHGLSLVAASGLLIAVASHCGARALGTRASVVVACRLSSCGAWA